MKKSEIVNESKTTFMLMLWIITLFVMITGASFAYFSIRVKGNKEASSIIINSANVGAVVFFDGQEIKANEIYPGWFKEKTFTISNNDRAASDLIDYEIYLIVKENTLGVTANAGTNKYFVHELTGVSTTNNGTLINVSQTAVPNTTGSHLLSENKGILNKNDSHTYKYKISFLEANVQQNNSQSKSFEGVLNVQISSGHDARTWDPDANGGKGGWKRWSSEE